MTDLGVTLHRCVLVARQRARLQQDGIRDSDLADVVQGSREAKVVERHTRESDRVGQHNGIPAHPFDVPVRLLIAPRHCTRQPLDHLFIAVERGTALALDSFEDSPEYPRAARCVCSNTRTWPRWADSRARRLNAPARLMTISFAVERLDHVAERAGLECHLGGVRVVDTRRHHDGELGEVRGQLSEQVDAGLARQLDVAEDRGDVRFGVEDSTGFGATGGLDTREPVAGEDAHGGCDERRRRRRRATPWSSTPTSLFANCEPPSKTPPRTLRSSQGFDTPGRPAL